HERIHELEDGDRALLGVTLREVIALEHARHGVGGSQLEQLREVERREPARVELDAHAVEIEDVSDLSRVGFRVCGDLLGSETRPCLAAAARVADAGGVIPDHEDHLVAEILERAQLPYRDRVSDVQVRTRRIKALLDAQSLAGAMTALQLADQIVFGDDLQRISPDLIHLLIDGREFRHGAEDSDGRDPSLRAHSCAVAAARAMRAAPSAASTVRSSIAQPGIAPASASLTAARSGPPRAIR